MRLSFPRPGLVGLVLLAHTAVVLSLSSSGCGRTACFVYTQAEYDHAGGTCPAQADALANFTGPHCTGPVTSVDGPGAFSLLSTDPMHQQGLCCYSVTQASVDTGFAARCTGLGGAGGTEGSSSLSGTSVVEVGVGEFAGSSGGPCATCDQVLMGVSMAQLCGQTPSQMAWQTLQTCLCGADAGACSAVCSLNVCQNQPITSDCASCVAGASVCGPALQACQAD